MLNKKHNWIPGKYKDKRKGFARENKTGNQTKTQDWWKNFAIESFDVVSFHETKAKKTEKERKKERKRRNQKKAKQERQ